MGDNKGSFDDNYVICAADHAEDEVNIVNNSCNDEYIKDNNTGGIDSEEEVSCIYI